MARDLIPPPSPAGRPDPDPEPAADPVAAATAATEPQDTGPVEPSPFRGRFGFVVGLLIGCGLVAVALIALLAGSDRGPAGDGYAEAWSAWKPTTEDTTKGAAQIAAHLQRDYRAADNGQLVAVSGGPIEIGGMQLDVALRPADGDIQILDGTGVQFTLNGLGAGGTLATGQPSEARHRLLRREALELALYTFRYLPKVSMVVALLPPATSAASKKAAKANPTSLPPGIDEEGREHQAVFYRRKDLEQFLRVPLGAILPGATPTIAGLAGQAEQARRIDALTMSNLFLVSYAQAQDAHAYLVLAGG